jgi:hypothetical protein
MALLSEWMQKCGKNVLDNAGIVRDAGSLISPLFGEEKKRKLATSPGFANHRGT